MSDQPIEEEIDDDPEYWKNRPPPVPAGPVRQRIIPSLLAVPIFLIVVALSAVVLTVAATISTIFSGGIEEAIAIVAGWGTGVAGVIWGRMAVDAVFKKAWNGWPSYIGLIAALGVVVWQAIVNEARMEGFMWVTLAGCVVLSLLTGFFFLVRKAAVEE
jgi:hypothetical protein